MSSSIRTALTGAGALVLCLAMHSMKWQHLLMSVAILGVAWAIWTWYRNSAAGENLAGNRQQPLPFDRNNRSGRRTTRNNVLEFPATIRGMSDA